MARKTTPDSKPASTVDESTAKIDALRKFNAEALEAIKTFLGERWTKVKQRAERMGLNDDYLSSLAGKMLSTRKARFPQDDDKALQSAVEGFLAPLDLRHVPAAAPAAEVPGDAPADVPPAESETPAVPVS